MLNQYVTKIGDAVNALEIFHEIYLDENAIHLAPEPNEEYVPDTFEQVCVAFSTQPSYPVWSGASDTSIYAVYGNGEHNNWNFRAVHDHLHYTMQCGFTVTEEAEIAFEHVAQFTRWAWSEDIPADVIATARAVLLIDTLGQTAVFHMTDGGFVYDQADFLALVIGSPNAPVFLNSCLEQKAMPSAALSYFIAGAMDGRLDDWTKTCNSYNPNI